MAIFVMPLPRFRLVSEPADQLPAQCPQLAGTGDVDRFVPAGGIRDVFVVGQLDLVEMECLNPGRQRGRTGFEDPAQTSDGGGAGRGVRMAAADKSGVVR